MSDHEDHSFRGRFSDLDEMNYHTWSYLMKMQLIQKDLWGIVNREVTQPISNVQAQTAWDRKNMLAIAEIRLHITQSQQVHMEFEFPADIWDRLQEIDKIR